MHLQEEIQQLTAILVGILTYSFLIKSYHGGLLPT